MDFSTSFIENSTYLTGMSGFQNNSDWSTFGTKSRALPSNVQQASNDMPLEERDMFSTRGYTAPHRLH